MAGLSKEARPNVVINTAPRGGWFHNNRRSVKRKTPQISNKKGSYEQSLEGSIEELKRGKEKRGSREMPVGSLTGASGILTMGDIEKGKHRVAKRRDKMRGRRLETAPENTSEALREKVDERLRCSGGQGRAG